MPKLLIKEDFISEDECSELLEWAKSCRSLLKPNPVSPHRFYRNIRVLLDSPLVNYVQQRVLKEYSLTDRQRMDGPLGSLLSFQEEGGQVQEHTDVLSGKRHLRFNLFLSVPESGGIPIYNGKEIPIKERLLIPYEADKYSHSSTVVVGNKPRIVISFGWAFDD